jgi:hypothetical protein
VRDEYRGHRRRVLAGDLTDHGGLLGKYLVPPGEYGDLGPLHVDLDHVWRRELVRE